MSVIVLAIHGIHIQAHHIVTSEMKKGPFPHGFYGKGTYIEVFRSLSSAILRSV